MDENKESGAVSTRRSFLRKARDIAIGAAAGAVGGGVFKVGVDVYDRLNPPKPWVDPAVQREFDDRLEHKPASRPHEPIATPTPPPTPDIRIKPAEEMIQNRLNEEINKIEQSPDINLLNNITRAQLKTAEREAAEDAFFNYALHKTDLMAQDIDRGLWVVTNPRIRQSLLGLRYNLRKNRIDPKLNPLDPDKEQWAKDNGISPETLAIAMDAYPKAKRILDAICKTYKAQFRPDVLYRESAGLLPKGTFAGLNAETMMINPGGLAKLIVTETGGVTYVLENGKDVHEGFTTIGVHSAWAETNINFFPTGHISLEGMRDLLKAQTNVDYQTKNIPGSARGDDKINASGGAVGIQIMPDNVMEILGITNNPEIPIDDADRWLNVFDLEDAAVMAWIFIARGVKVGNTKDAFRTGYLKGPRDENAPPETKNYFARLRNWAIEKWNPFGPQRDAIIKAANSYSDKFRG